MKTENKTKLWDFLEANMTNYSQDKRIYRIDRLDCFIDGSLSIDEIFEHGFDKYSDCMAKMEINNLTDECFAEAMENFTKKSKIQMVFEAMLRGDYVMLSRSALEEAGDPDYGPRARISSIYSDGIISLCDDEMDIISEITTDDIEFIP